MNRAPQALFDENSENLKLIRKEPPPKANEGLTRVFLRRLSFKILAYAPARGGSKSFSFRARSCPWGLRGLGRNGGANSSRDATRWSVYATVREVGRNGGANSSRDRPSGRLLPVVLKRFRPWAWQRGAWLPWIFIHGTDKVEGSLIVIFFGLVFSVTPPLEIFLPAPLISAIWF